MAPATTEAADSATAATKMTRTVSVPQSGSSPAVAKRMHCRVRRSEGASTGGEQVRDLGGRGRGAGV